MTLVRVYVVACIGQAFHTDHSIRQVGKRRNISAFNCDPFFNTASSVVTFSSQFLPVHRAEDLALPLPLKAG